MRPETDALAQQLTRLTPQQPATVLWRVIELEALLRHGLPGGSGLDLGCGDGRLVTALRDRGFDASLVGLDADPAECALARESGEYVRVEEASAAGIPEKAGSFDFVFSNSVLEHIPGLETVLAEAARVLRPGGRLIATVPTDRLNASLRGAGVLAPLLGRKRDVYLDRMNARTAHVNLWSAERWRKELGAAGFERVELTAYLTPVFARRWERISNWSGGVAYALFGRRDAPIDISRRLSIDTGGGRSRLLRPVANGLVRRALRDYEPERSRDEADGVCLLIEASVP